LGQLAYIDPTRISANKAPTVKQVYAIAHLAVQALEREWPSSRREASELITELEVEPAVRTLDAAGGWIEAG